MKKIYQSPSATALHIYAESMLAQSPGLNNELGSDDQLSNEKNSSWDAPDWAADEED